MAAAPGLLIEKDRLVNNIGGTFSGIEGDANHTYGYHVTSPPSSDYSMQGLRNWPVGPYACAIDIGMDWAASRDWLRWFIAAVRDDRRHGIAEVIGSFDGQDVRYWSDSSGWHQNGEPYQGEGHDTWSHVAIYRSTANEDHRILAGWTANGMTGGDRIDLPADKDEGMSFVPDDYGPYGKPPAIGDRTTAVLIADLWGQNLNETSPYAAKSPSAVTARLARVEAKVEKLSKPAAAGAVKLDNGQLSELARLVANSIAGRLAKQQAADTDSADAP